MAADPHTLRHPLLRCAERVHAAVDAAMDSDPAYLRVEDKRAAIGSVGAAIDRMRALQARLLANSDDVAVKSGAKNVAASPGGREGPGMNARAFIPALRSASMGTPSADIVEDLAPTGRLRASINLGNPVLAHGTPGAPGGVTVDIAREVGARLGVPVELVCFDAARKSFEAMTTGRADLCFLAVEPAREAEVAFTAPYVVIEGVYAVACDSPIRGVGDVDRAGVRIGVKRGSAYDLFLSRTLQHAEVVRGDEGVGIFHDEDLEVAAGIRQPLTEHVAAHPGLRLLDGRFMEIRQAVGTTTTRRPDTVAFLRETVEELRAGGFVAEALGRSGQSPDLVAAPV